jgi:anaerobic selenocysteine-containing dehydrogenase
MSEKTLTKTTCPRDCYDACGIVVIKRDGEVTKVLGDPEHPVARGALCGKCAIAYNGTWRDPAKRLARPLIRSGPKGSGRFREASWDEALALAAERLNAVRARLGGAGILNTHYTGTCSLLAGGFPQRFFNALGATEVEPDTICNNAGHAALRYVLGASAVGFDPRSARDAACIVVWGANPSASAPHAHKHWLREAPGKVVVVDPIRHATAAQADLHLQPRPGTDAALAFALLHVLRRDDKLDPAFITWSVLGWNEIDRQLDACTPAWGEAATGVPAALIEQAAALYASGPAMLWLGQGLQRQPNGGNAFRAIACLPAATGNIGRAGSGLYYLNGGARRGLDGDYLEGAALAPGGRPSISHMDLPAALADPAKAGALISWNMNVAASGPRQAELRAGLARDDLFVLVAELFLTDTAKLADVVLPAASFLEFDDLVSSYFNLTLSAQAKVEEPPGEALPNSEIFRRLARALGLTQPELYEADRAVIDRLLAGSGHGIGFDALKAQGTATLYPEPVIAFAEGRFRTPSGRIELASPRAAADGHPLAPLPLADAPAQGGRLRLLSPASPWLMNDSYGNDPGIQKQLGPAAITLHPDDAARLGLRDGQAVRVTSPAGALDLTLALDAALVTPGTAFAPKGRWGENVNALFEGRKSDLGESTAVHGQEISVRAR